MTRVITHGCRLWAGVWWPVLIGAAPSVSAQSPAWTEDFELGAVHAGASSWSVWPVLAYRIAVTDSRVFEGQWALVFEPVNPQLRPDLANLTRTFDAGRYRGRRLRLRAFARTEFPAPADSARLWFVINRPLGVGASNLQKAFRSDAWQAHEIESDVPPDAEAMMIGVIISGGGRVWLDSLSLQVAGPAVPVRDMSPGARLYLDSALVLMRRFSIRRQSVPWDSLTAQAWARAAGAQSPAETHDAIREALRRLGDRHSLLIPAERGRRMGSTGPLFADSQAQMADSRVARLSIQPFGGWDSLATHRFARSMHDAIARLAPQATCGWIVDLRLNTGGNFWPMLAGVGPLLGEGVAGAFVLPDGSRSEWSYVNGAARVGDSVRVRVPGVPFSFHGQLPRVAVLLGTGTSSSGEALAISFRGRPKTRSFGQPTFGVSSANTPFEMPDSAYLVLTTALDADRNGVMFGDVVRPDESIRPPDRSPDRDPVLSAGLKWLLDQPDCLQDRR